MAHEASTEPPRPVRHTVRRRLRAIVSSNAGGFRDRLNEIEDDTQVAKLISYVATHPGVFLDHLASANGVPPREILRRMKADLGQDVAVADDAVL